MTNGGWTLVANVLGTNAISSANYTNGLGSTDYLPLSEWIHKVSDFNTYTNPAMRIDMGTVKDYFIPNGVSFSTMVTTSPTNNFKWTNSLSKPFIIPSYYTHHLGGSMNLWPANNVYADSRNYLSFWGANNGTTLGGCCHETYSDVAGWGKPFKMWIKEGVVNNIDSSLIARWAFDEGAGTSAYDLAGNNHGTLYNGPIWATKANCVTGGCLTFDNSNDYVNAGTGINLVNKSFSIAVWAKRASSGTWDFIIGQGPNGYSTGLHVGFRDGNTFTFAFYSNDLDTPVTYTDTNWHHWVCTYDSVSRARIIYRDGVVVASGTASANYQGTGVMQIGLRQADGLLPFHGSLDDIRIYNKVLSPTEVVNVYNER
ncbi:MAG: hypothetical protein BWY21_01822 [Parcubacteria group bacterium ADurb.Bin216]|nr:MAG: hypothetical protein BWY21_01822 [Parcubacteria group bacterium ADurb.Bin216]